jgi:hypothetical protein
MIVFKKNDANNFYKNILFIIKKIITNIEKNKQSNKKPDIEMASAGTEQANELAKEMERVLTDARFATCIGLSLKVGDDIFGLKEQPDGTYRLWYIGTIGSIETVKEFRDMWATCGDIDVIHYYDTKGNRIENIESLYKQVMVSIANSYNVKIGDMAYSEDGAEAGIVTEISNVYLQDSTNEHWAWADGPKTTKMVKLNGGNLVKASMLYIKV